MTSPLHNLLPILVPILLLVGLVYYFHMESKMMFQEVMERQDRLQESLTGTRDTEETEDPDSDPVGAFMSGLKFDDQERPQGAFGSPIITMHVLGEDGEGSKRSPGVPAASLHTIDEETGERQPQQKEEEELSANNTISHVRKRKKANHNTEIQTSLSS